MPQADAVLSSPKLTREPDPGLSNHGSPGSGTAADEARQAIDRRSAHAFFKMESSIHDLVEMAKIANRRVYDAVGELKIVDGRSVKPIDEGNISSALFVTSHLLDMICKLEADYEADFHAAKRS